MLAKHEMRVRLPPTAPRCAMKLRTKIALSLIILLSIILHLYKISYPDEVVFDEAYYAGQVSNYQNGVFFYDIHPPLAKIIYWGVISVVSPSLPFRQFLKIELDEQTKKILVARLESKYKDFPYVALRVTNALFGVSLVLLVFILMRNLGVSERASLLASFLLALENAILLDSRTIMLNAIFLSFGFLSLVLYTGERRKSILAGIFFGLSVATKLSGVVFMGPAAVFHILYRKDDYKKDMFKFCVTGFLVYLAIISSQNFFFSLQDRIDVWNDLGAKQSIIMPTKDDGFLIGRSKGAIYEIYQSIGGYLITVKSTPINDKYLASKWYEWPFMKKIFLYYTSGNGKEIYMMGNPVIWYWGTISVIAWLILIFRLGMSETRPARVLLAGYLFALIPLSVVQRFTFLSHYFTALIFSILLFACLFDFALSRIDETTLPRLKRQIYFLITFLASISFILAAQYTY